MSQSSNPENSERLPRRAWFGFVGGAVAWCFHLGVCAITAEWMGFAGVELQILGIHLAAWLTILWTFLASIVAAAAFLAAYQQSRLQRSSPNEEPEAASSPTLEFLTRAGMMNSGIFLVFIVVESLPILFFLHRTA